jgi:hypothetical protein
MGQFSQVLIASQTVNSTIHATVSNTPPLTAGQIIVSVSARTGGSITPSIEGYDPASATWYTILTGTSMSSISQQVLQVGPNFAVTSNVSVNTILPSFWRVTLTSSSANLTASVGANLAP